MATGRRGPVRTTGTGQPWVAAAACSSNPTSLPSRSAMAAATPVAAGLDHHPDQRLGAAGPQQHPTAVAEAGLFLGDRRPHRLGRPQEFRVGDRHVDQHLGDPGDQPVQQVGQRPAGAGDQVSQDQTGEQPVAGGGQAPEDDVARLLPAEGETVLVECGQHVPVPDLRSP